MRLSTALLSAALLASSAVAHPDLQPRCKFCPDYVPECTSCPDASQVCIFLPETCDKCAMTTCVAPSAIPSVAGPTINPIIPTFTPETGSAAITTFTLHPLPPGVTPSPTGPRSAQPGGPESPAATGSSSAGAGASTSAGASAAGVSAGASTSAPATTAAAVASTSASAAAVSSTGAAANIRPLGLGVAVLAGLGALV